MDISSLGPLELQTFQEAILGTFEGSCTLGVGIDTSSNNPAFFLSVIPGTAYVFPQSIVVNGITVKVIISKDLQQPTPHRVW